MLPAQSSPRQPTQFEHHLRADSEAVNRQRLQAYTDTSGSPSRVLEQLHLRNKQLKPESRISRCSLASAPRPKRREDELQKLMPSILEKPTSRAYPSHSKAMKRICTLNRLQFVLPTLR
ncbi:hypothetical protein BDV11DRAFT_5926 [Aspergillus similis]